MCTLNSHMGKHQEEDPETVLSQPLMSTIEGAPIDFRFPQDSTHMSAKNLNLRIII